jgi:thioredoxin reductase (NADPH)
MDTTYDLIILGGGPAGLNAAIYATRGGLRTLVIDEAACGGLVNSTHVVENYPSHKSIGGMELMGLIQDQAELFGATILEAVEVQDVTLEGPCKTVVTDEGTFSAKALIIATGRKPKQLPLDVEANEVHYCAICDGSLYKGKSVIVVGGGNSGVEESFYLLDQGVEHITLLEKENRLFASETAQKKIRSDSRVDVFVSTEIVDLEVDGKLRAAVLRPENGKTPKHLPADGIFVYLGQDPATALFDGKILLNDAGYVIADENMKTNVDGVFSAGDVNNKTYRQITTAVSDGTIAALGAIEYNRMH